MSAIGRLLRRAALCRLLAGALASVAVPSAAMAADPRPPSVSSVVVLPAVIAEGSGMRPPRVSDGDLGRLAQSLDALLSDTAQDLGLAVVPPPRAGVRLGDADLLRRARDARALVLLPSLRAAEGGEVDLRLTLADPTSRAVDVRHAQVSRADLPVQAVVLLRDLARRHGKGAARSPALPGSGAAAPAPSAATPGRISLMANATLFGGLLGYSIQRGSGSEDPRLLYPLLIVGAGVGLGASLVATGEWEVKTGDAWYWAAGVWWPSAAAHLIFQGRFAEHLPGNERWAFGLLGGAAGATIGSLGLSLHSMDEGGALIAHSGGALGLAFGALSEMAARGDTRHTPFSGMGYGAALGWLAAAAAATQVRASPLRVLAVDAGAVLGGLAGAAAGSPLLVTGAKSAGKQRAWASITLGAALAGGAAAGVIARPRGKVADLHGTPLLGVLGESRIGARSAPILGVGWSGVLE